MSAQPQTWLRPLQGFATPALWCWMLGLGLAAYLPLPWCQPMMAGALSLIALAVVVGSRRPRVIRVGLWVLCLILGSLYWSLRVPSAEVRLPILPLDTVATVWETVPQGSRLVVRLAQPLPGVGQRLMVRCRPKCASVRPGDSVRVRGGVLAPEPARFPGAFDERRWLLGQDIAALVWTDSPVTVLARPAGDPWSWVLHTADAQRQRLSGLFRQALAPPMDAVLGGIVLGDRAMPVDPQTRQQFARTGLVHLLAASGMNVALVTGAVLWLGRRARLPERVSLLVALGSLAGYVILAGASPSVLRAGTMLAIALGLRFLAGQLSGTLLLAVAAAVLLLFQPTLAVNLGFQLSVFTAGSLVTVLPTLQSRLGQYTTQAVAGWLLAPLVAQLAVLPVQASVFHQVPLQALLCNVLAVAMVAPLTLLGFAAAVVGLLWPTGGVWLASLGTPCLWGLVALARWGDQLSGWVLTSATWPMGQMLAVGAWLLLLAWLVAGRVPAVLASPVRRATLAVATLLWLLVPGLTARWEAQDSVRLARIPLEGERLAWLLWPAGVNQPVMLAPPGLSRWDGKILLSAIDGAGASHQTPVYSPAMPDRTLPSVTVRQLPGAGLRLNGLSVRQGRNALCLRTETAELLLPLSGGLGYGQWRLSDQTLIQDAGADPHPL